MTMQIVKPIRPAAPYIGGKRNLAKRLIGQIHTIPHKTYVEPFCGMGGVFFRRNQKPRCEVINDLNGEVINFFRIVQRHPEPLIDILSKQLSSRAEFSRLKTIDPAHLTDLERAARFIYLQSLAFGGRVTRRAFGTTKAYPARFDHQKLGPKLEAIFERLSGVIIENLPYLDCINLYDSPDTLFYLDPPYWDSEKEYGETGFSRADYETLAERLAHIKGRFILSLNDTSGIRTIFAGFDIEEADVCYTISQKKTRLRAEVIIHN